MRHAIRLLSCCISAVLFTWSALAAATPPNYQGLWWNSPPGSESGWGINLSHQGDTIFATWFTYDAAGQAWWLAMTAGKTAEGTYGGTLIETSGPGFDSMTFAPGVVTRLPVGRGTLTFSDADNGTFRYSLKGVEQSKAISRFAFGPLPTCTYGPQPNFVAATNYQDLWWVADGAESGWGVNLAHEGDTIFATWFTYEHDGTPQWLATTAEKVGPGVYSGALVRTIGPAFSTPAFDPAMVRRTTAGTASFNFANGNAATFTYALDGITRTKAMSRFLFAPPAGTRCGAQETATIKGKVFDGYLEQAVVCADANGNGRCDPGEERTLSGAGGAYELAAPAGYSGPLAAEVVAGQSRDSADSGAAVDRSYRMASPRKEYSANITPFTTLVHLTREKNFRLGESLVRNELGLPPGFLVNLTAAPADGSLAQAVARSVVAALKATPATLDFSSPDALAKVVAAFPPALTDLPQLRITTKGGVPITSKEVYVDATFTLTNPAASVPAADLNGKIRGRGHTTWTMGWKKPYKIQFTNDASYAKVPDFLGMRKNRNWALLADYFDRSLLRNKLAFTLGNSSLFADGLTWTSSGQHVEVTLNGDYVGVYLLTEDIRIDSARVNVRKMSTDPAAREVDGGYIVEVNIQAEVDCYKDKLVNLQHRTPMQVPVCIDKPDEADITPAQEAYIKNLLDETETDIYGRNSLAMVNPVSYADWYLLNELFRNNDAPFFSSDYMWKDTASAADPTHRVLNMGPIWDFDLSAGNINFNENWKTDGCWVSKSPGPPNWIAKLFDNVDFLDLTLARWKDKRQDLEKFINASVATFSRRLAGGQQRNFTRWPQLGTQDWNNYYVFATYGEEVAFLKGYLKERMAWLDRAFASRESFASMCK